MPTLKMSAKLLGLQWGDVDLDAGTLIVGRSGGDEGRPATQPPKTKRGRRNITLPPDEVAHAPCSQGPAMGISARRRARQKDRADDTSPSATWRRAPLNRTPSVARMAARHRRQGIAALSFPMRSVTTHALGADPSRRHVSPSPAGLGIARRA